MLPTCRPDRQMPPDLRRHHKSGDICPQYCDVSRVDWLTLMSGSAGHGQNHGTSPLPDFERQQKLQLPFEHNPIRHPSSPSSHPIQQHEYLSLSAITIGTSILYFLSMPLELLSSLPSISPSLSPLPPLRVQLIQRGHGRNWN